MPTYQYDFDDDTWDEWKETVPRDTPLGERLEELIEADAKGHVYKEGEQFDPPFPLPDEKAVIGDRMDELDDPDELLTADEVADELDMDTPDVPGALEYADFPGHLDADECKEAALAARDHIRENGGASMSEIVVAVMADHPVGYDAESHVEKVEDPDRRNRSTWWRKVVKPGLSALPGVEKPSQSASTWRYVGES